MMPPGLSRIAEHGSAVAIVTVVLAGFGAWLALVCFSHYLYEIQGEWLIVRRRALGGIPLGTTRIRLDDIHVIERSVAQVPWGALLRGSPLAREGVVIALDPRHRPQRIYLAPRDPAKLVSELASLTRATVIEVPTRDVRTFLDLCPLWLADLWAVMSGVLTALALTLPRSMAENSGGWIFVCLTVASMVAMVLLMMYDSLRAPRGAESRLSTLWPFLVVFLFPSAWLYYVVEWRRRHRH
jgi:uncharacterized membrane-anchored protein